MGYIEEKVHVFQGNGVVQIEGEIIIRAPKKLFELLDSNKFPFLGLSSLANLKLSGLVESFLLARNIRARAESKIKLLPIDTDGKVIDIRRGA